MIFKIILLPFTIIKLTVGFIFGIVKFIVFAVFGIFRFIISRIFGTVFGALIGFFFGGGSLKIRMPSKKQNK
ncbi:MAG: hypothetical protein PVI26_10375 [Chitinispirillia bacterium]|jgi:hypothetical protein